MLASPGQLRISAKNLGALALPDCCSRCYWINLKTGFKLPYQIFPGIFSSIDAYGKNIVESWFERHQGPPEWLKPLGDIQSYVSPPHHSKFKVVVEECNVLLTGTPDAIFRLRDSSHLIADYKTARYTANQDTLFPMYEVQLNAYAVIAQGNGLSPVSTLALVYFEPVTDEQAVTKDSLHQSCGFQLGFATHICFVPLTEGMILPLVRKARALFDLNEPPKPRQGCKNCGSLDEIMTLIGTR